MFYWAMVFLAVALITGLFGFGTLAAGTAELIFSIFVAISIATLIIGVIQKSKD
ncbi:DUF1328 domain-containing protein [Litoreibacter roseus]|uniref:UPF0391 membrane protein n=1 Tax=Litoreibacter roseus TaxID=2601869 RepID=A0A6N6JIE3_9RHOB|nr:DUF1328 domain-containing protein [Litoreibacter roseus]GFE66111.1 UPF0391 membrane protein [Litoreibacter roseus]